MGISLIFGVARSRWRNYTNNESTTLRYMYNQTWYDIYTYIYVKKHMRSSVVLLHSRQTFSNASISSLRTSNMNVLAGENFAMCRVRPLERGFGFPAHAPIFDRLTGSGSGLGSGSGSGSGSGYG
jgi:hypothetical protein